VKRQGGFALFLMLMVSTVTVGVVYAKMVGENTRAIRADSRKTAVKVFPAIDGLLRYALTQYATSNSNTTYEGSDFYGSEYTISSSYQSTLTDVGFDTSDVSVTISSLGTQDTQNMSQ